MKKTYTLITALVLTIAAGAQTQTLNVKVGCVTYQFPTTLTGDMSYSNSGSLLTIMANNFTTGDIDEMTVAARSKKSDNTVNVTYGNDTPTITIADEQWADEGRIDERTTNQPLFNSSISGIRLNLQMDGVTHVEVESVDAYPIASGSYPSILTFKAPEGTTLQAGQDYTVTTFPCNVYGGYRLSIYKDGLVAHYFGVHQVAEAGSYITPLDLDESELEFDDPDAPLVEEERPELDKKTKELLRIYKQNPTDENYQALYDQMGVRYDKVVARKKAKLRELEREAHHQSLIDEMQGIVDEMVTNREERLWQRFLSLIDSRRDDNANDQWCVLKGAWQENAYIGYVPVTNAEYKIYKPDFTYAAGQENYPVVDVSYEEAVAYCDWLSAQDTKHAYRLPSEYEWILAAGHMPKDVSMNSNFVENGLTPVDAYASSVGNCGGIDFWGNCWEWTSTQTASGEYIVKGGAWDSSRDQCRSEYSDDTRDGSQGYQNVGFRAVRVDRQETIAPAGVQNSRAVW